MLDKRGITMNQDKYMDTGKMIEAAYTTEINLMESDIAALKRHIGKFKNDDCLDLKLAIAKRYGRIQAYKGILNRNYGYNLHYNFDMIGKIREVEQEVK